MSISSNVAKDFTLGAIVNLYDYSNDAMQFAKTKEKWPEIFAQKDITSDHWQMTSFIGPKMLRKTGQAEGYQYTKAAEGYTAMGAIFNYTDAVAMNYDTKNDHQKFSDIMKECANGWGEGSIVTRDQFYARVFNYGGFTAGDFIFNGTPESGAQTDLSGDGCYDGTAANIVAPFCRTGDTYKHTSKIGGSTYYNALASGTITPGSIVNLVNLVEVTNSFDEKDVNVPMVVDTIVYPQGQWETIGRILDSDKLAFTNNNDTNQGLKRKFKNRIEWEQLTNTTAIFVGVAKKGITALNRQDPVFDFFEEKKDRCYVATASMRMGLLFHNWRFWACDNASQS